MERQWACIQTNSSQVSREEMTTRLTSAKRSTFCQKPQTRGRSKLALLGSTWRCGNHQRPCQAGLHPSTIGRLSTPISSITSGTQVSNTTRSYRSTAPQDVAEEIEEAVVAPVPPQEEALREESWSCAALGVSSISS